VSLDASTTIALFDIDEYTFIKYSDEEISSFTILSLSSIRISACGYSPYGEDVRYTLFLPKYFNYKEYSRFYYNNFIWGYDASNDSFQDKIGFGANVLDWYNYLGNKVPIDEIDFFNNHLTLTDIHSYSNNLFLKFLFNKKRSDVIKYLTYAKKCEGFTSYDIYNTWERDEEEHKIETSKFQNELVRVYHHEKNIF